MRSSTDLIDECVGTAGELRFARRWIETASRASPNIASDSWRGDRHSVRAIFAVFYPSVMRGSSYVIESPRARGRERFRATEITEARLESVERSTTDTRDSSRNGRVPSSRPANLESRMFQQNILYFQGRPTVSLALFLSHSLFFSLRRFSIKLYIRKHASIGIVEDTVEPGLFLFYTGYKNWGRDIGSGEEGSSLYASHCRRIRVGRFHCFLLRDAPNSRGFALQR